MKKSAAIAALCALGACAPGNSNLLAKLSTFTVADLQAADVIAVQAGDTIAHACFPVLIAWIQTLPSGQQVVTGAISTFEVARTTRLGVQKGIPDSVKMGCAALLVDEQTLLLKLGALGAGSIIGL